jgi:hypothetical protein
VKPKKFAINGAGIGGGRGLPKGNAPPKPHPAKTHPVDGMPVMASAAELRAQANSQAWKSIAAQQAALPSDESIARQYGAQRSAIQPLIDAHRSWLENAGQYMVGSSNALSTLVTQKAAEADQAQQGIAGLAGAPGSAPGTNVSPTSAAMPVAAYGTSFANYLRSLVPYADAVGGNALGRTFQNENQDMTSLRDARTKIAGGLPDLQASNYATLSTNALNEYKGELAALVAGQKGGVAAAGVAEKTRHDQTLEQLARDRNATASRRADASIALDQSKIKAGGKVNNSEVSSLKKDLTDAFKIYEDKGGTKTPTRFGVTLTLNQPTLPGRPKAPKQTKAFAGATIEEVRALVKAFLAKQPKQGASPIPVGKWSQDDIIKAAPNSTTTTGKLGESTRRLKAWRYLVQHNAASLHPLDESALRELFRKGVGAPPGK